MLCFFDNFFKIIYCFRLVFDGKVIIRFAINPFDINQSSVHIKGSKKSGGRRLFHHTHLPTLLSDIISVEFLSATFGYLRKIEFLPTTIRDDQFSSFLAYATVTYL